MRALMAATACVLLISACGIKGPLYLPPADPTPAGSPPAEAPPADIDPSPIDSPE
ncbi:MAG: lipoprotein [Betaproteobacteria bacterium]|nr:lipoprotein [Betaproteobacteria bacterium]